MQEHRNDEAKKKRAACVGKRPKSREETPKEGSDNAKALPHRNNMRPRCTKRKGFLNDFPMQNSQGSAAAQKTKVGHFLS
jgi:hypothetical protein